MGEMVSFRVDTETKRQIQVIATANDRKLADAVRLLFLRGFEKFDVKKDRL